jgi:hypothetical protein
MKLNNSHPVGWLLLFLPAFPSHIPAVGNVGIFLHQYMLLFLDTIWCPWKLETMFTLSGRYP